MSRKSKRRLATLSFMGVTYKPPEKATASLCTVLLRGFYGGRLDRWLFKRPVFSLRELLDFYDEPRPLDYVISLLSFPFFAFHFRSCTLAIACHAIRSRFQCVSSRVKNGREKEFERFNIVKWRDLEKDLSARAASRSNAEAVLAAKPLFTRALSTALFARIAN